MPILTMLVGISGAGKTTYGKQLAEKSGALLLSSDDLRQELWGDYTDQQHPEVVFAELNRRTKTALRAGKNVVYDATNLSARRRKALLQSLNRVNSLIKNCVVCVADIDEILERKTFGNLTTEEYRAVLTKQATNFQSPWFNEGWDSIRLVQTGEKQIHLQKLFAGDPMPHLNPHHSLSVQDHMLFAARAVEHTKVSDYVKVAVLYHDIGKLRTQTIDKNGIAHYYGHEGMGAWMFLCSTLAATRPDDALVTAAIISWHMLPYNTPKERITSKLGINLGAFVLELNQFDKDY